jgi:hypothetical protein
LNQPQRAIHRLKNGALAHVLTTEDRRKAAAVTNEIRREKRLLLVQLELEREIDAELAKRDARRRRKREQARRRREESRIQVWHERGYGARP